MNHIGLAEEAHACYPSYLGIRERGKSWLKSSMGKKINK
jgi:hypothetical protein